MSIQSIRSHYSPTYSLDEILQDTPETATEKLSDIEATYQSYKDELNEELKTTDRVWLEFQAGQCEQFGKAAKAILYRIVKSSVGHLENSIAAANAITILKTMKVSFSCLDLRGVQIPGADLSSAILDRADLSGANLEKVRFANAALNYLKLSNANLKNVKFEIPEALIHEDNVWENEISFDSKYLVSEDIKYIYLWDIPSKTRIGFIEQPKLRSPIKRFTSDGRFLFIYNSSKIYIYSTKDFNCIKKIPITDLYPRALYLSPSSFCFITIYKHKNLLISKTYLKVWEIQETENAILEFTVKEESTIPDYIQDILFSKKFHVIYCLKGYKHENKDETSRLDLYICTLEKLSEIVNIPNIIPIPFFNATEIDDGLLEKAGLSIDTLDQGKEHEETLLIAFGQFIYSVIICKKNEQSFSLAIFEPTKIIDEVAAIYNLRVLKKTYELIYVCNNTICLFNILNNQHIGRYRLYDTKLYSMPFSSDGKNMFINDSNRVSIYSLENLKSNKYISYDLDCKAVCFLSDKRTIITIGQSLLMTEYDIETGCMLKSNMLKLASSNILRGEYNISFSSNSKSILISSFYDFDKVKSYVINARNKKMYLEEAVYPIKLSNNSKYAACIDDTEKKLKIYKIIPSKQSIGEFILGDHILWSDFAFITISTDFYNIPIIAFIVRNVENIILYYFQFEGQILALKKKQSHSIEAYRILNMQFIHHNSTLIIVFKDRIMLWNLEKDSKENYEISAKNASVSQDGALLIYCDSTEVNSNERSLRLWSVEQRKDLIVQPISIPISKLQISSDNRYIIGTVENGGIYVWKIFRDSFRLLWRTSHNLQALGLILGDNNLEKDVEEDLIAKMGAIKL